jgi:hypothetical protein
MGRHYHFVAIFLCLLPASGCKDLFVCGHCSAIFIDVGISLRVDSDPSCTEDAPDLCYCSWEWLVVAGFL